ncbi:MAG: 2-amino-4-hydroxy-6-hydroxymethyldihydropteridine diphosphokinase [Adhaeribacter sp.]
MASTFLLLGSNQGDRFALLTAARRHLQDDVGSIRQASAIYETAAWGLQDQPAFLNQVLLLETALQPEDLLREINRIEKALGRVREVKWAARVIDIDILYYDDLVLQTERLQIPHPYLQDRRFTLLPLAEIAPDWLHPVFQKTNRQLLDACPDKLEARKLDN